ncbi:MAG: hypothetical protein ACRDRP_01685 [Pseudonocardiaceae bacterium]
MRKRSSLLVAGACLASLTCTAATAMADPIGDPVFRDLAGVGSDTTNAVMNGLANGTGPETGFGGITINGIRVIGSYDAFGSAQITTKQTPPANCTIRRPAGSVNGLNALAADTNGCIQFARSTVNDGRPGLRYLRFAVDAVTYTTRPDTLIPKSLTVAQLVTIYNCQGPAADPPGPNGPAILPLLPEPGSGTRNFFLTKLGFNPGAFSTAPGDGHECVRDRLAENDGTVLTDPRHIAPYSIPQYLSQAHGLSPDRRGSANLRSINGIGPVMPNPDSGEVTYVTRPDTVIPRSLTVAQLVTVYNCQGPAADPPGPDGPSILPLLPGPGSGTRDSFLTKLGFNPGAFSTAPGQGHECVRDTNLDGVTPLDENDGRVLFDPRQIAPYSIPQYLSQAHGLSPDRRGSANLRSIDSIGPVMLNPDSVMSRDTYNVLRDSQVGTPPVSTVFAGPGSLVCTNTATIKRFGFAPHPLCGT